MFELHDRSHGPIRFGRAAAAYRDPRRAHRARVALGIALIAGFASCSAAPPLRLQEFDLQGHRGARGLVPENTLPGFERALDLEVTTLELDLHWSADDALVVWHDPLVGADKCRVDPTSAAPLPPDPESARPERLVVRQLTREQLAGYRCDRNPDPERFPDQRAQVGVVAGDDYSIASLSQVFDLVERYAKSPHKSAAQRAAAARVRFNIETKRDADHPGNIGDDFDGENAGRFERELERLVRERGLEDRVTLQSFDHRSLWAMRALGSPIALAALTESEFDLPELAARGARTWSPWHESVTDDTLEQAHSLGMLVVPWTVNEAARMRELIALGVDGIISDRPDVLVEALAAFGR